MNKVIIYGSKYGAALEYAKELSKKMEIPLISHKKVKNINEYDHYMQVVFVECQKPLRTGI